VIAALLVFGPAARAEGLADLDDVDKIEDLSLEDLLEKPIIAASNIEQRPKDSPAVVSVVDGDDLRRLGVRDLGSALAGMRGVYATNDRNYSYIGIRGESIPGDYNTRIQLAIDDHKITDPVYSQALTGAELGLPLAAIERIELVRGAASSTYGSNALLGAIHIVTATGAMHPGLQVSATTTATAETFADPAHRPDVAFYGEQLAASYGAVVGATDVFAAASYLRAPGLSAIYMPELANPAEVCVDAHHAPVPCDGVVRDIDHEEAGSVYAAVRHGGFRLSGLASSRVKQIPTASFGTVIGDPDTRMTDQRVYLDGGYHTAIGEAELDTRLAWDVSRYHGTYPYYEMPADGDPSYLAGRSVYRDAMLATWFTGEARVRWRRGELWPGVTDVDTLAGAEAVAVPTAIQIDGPTDRDDHELQLAGYAQAEARIAGRIVGSAGTRVDVRPSSFGVSNSSRLGILVDPWPEGRIRATLGTAFRAPNLYERFYYANQASEPTLQPERSTTAELSVEQYLGEHVRAIVAGYRNQLSDLLALVPTDVAGANLGQSYVYRNGGTAHGEGVEAELEARWRGTVLRGNLAVQRTEDEMGQTLPNSPHTLGNLAIALPLVAGRAHLTIASSFIGRRRSASGVTIDAAFRTDLAVDIPRVAGTRFDLGLGIQNAFDQRSAAPGSEEHRQSAIPENPRLIWIRIGAHL
jgi:outer membrane cobalamin receptor